MVRRWRKGREKGKGGKAVHGWREGGGEGIPVAEGGGGATRTGFSLSFLFYGARPNVIVGSPTQVCTCCQSMRFSLAAPYVRHELMHSLCNFMFTPESLLVI